MRLPKIEYILEIASTNATGSIELLYDDLKEWCTEEQLRIIKYKMKGYKNIEIAKKLNVCPATITKRIMDIKTILKGYLRNEYNK
jgi:DNA-binding NarL/FixJ family response regulator